MDYRALQAFTISRSCTWIGQTSPRRVSSPSQVRALRVNLGTDGTAED